MTIADDLPSGSGYTLRASYDDGVTWVTVDVAAPLGLSTYDAATQLPSVVASSLCRFSATNNDTTDEASTSNFTLAGDVVLGSWSGIGDPNQGGISLAYQSDAAEADVAGGDPSTCGFTADTSGGSEGSISVINSVPNNLTASFTDDLTPDGNFTLDTAGNLTFDRPAATCPGGQSFIISGPVARPRIMPHV